MAKNSDVYEKKLIFIEPDNDPDTIDFASDYYHKIDDVKVLKIDVVIKELLVLYNKYGDNVGIFEVDPSFGYLAYAEFREETDEEYNKRIKKFEKRKNETLERKKKQFKKLQKELQEAGEI